MTALGHALDDLGVATRLLAVGSGRLSADVVVVDSYRLAADDPAAIDARKRAAVDDLERALRVDLLVDPNPARRVVDRAGVVLAGPAYALLEPGLSALRDSPEPASPRVLVTFGGTDGDGLGALVSRAVRDALPDETSVTLVRGPWSTAAPVDANGIDVINAPTGLLSAIATSTVVVTAAGVTMLEALAAGRPVVAVIAADNQARQARAAASAGAIVLTTAERAASAAEIILRDPALRVSLRSAGLAYVDTRGAQRVAQAVVSL